MDKDNALIEYLLFGQYQLEQDDAISDDPQETVQAMLSDKSQPAEQGQEVLKTKRITDEMPGGFFIYRADETEEIIYANKALFRIFNCETLEEFQELTGNTFRGIVHPDDLEEVERSIEQQIKESKYDLDYVEYRIIQKGGEIRWIEDYGHFIRSDFAGDVFYVFVGDATEKHRRQQAEWEMVNQEQLRRLEMIEGLSIDYESILYVNREEKIFRPYRLSARLAEKFEENGRVYRFSECAGFVSDYVNTWVYPDDREKLLSMVNPAFIQEQLSQKKLFYVNYRILMKEDVEYLQLCIVNVGSAKNGAQVIIGCRSIDGSVRHEMEQKRILEAALSQAKVSNIVKDTFLSNMSHDIRTPMNAIVGFTALAKTHMKDETRLCGYLDKIEISCKQLIQLLNDVLELSRLSDENLRLNETVCDLREIALGVKKAILPQAEEKGILLSVEFAALEHPEVCSSRQYLLQSLLRLADNAVKYTEKGGSITISMEEQKVSHGFAAYQFVVEDTGIGISESFVGNIFEPFERENNTTMSGVQGTGLGLTLAKNMVEMLGGTIAVDSTLGKGSRFTITISLRLPEETYGEPAAEEPQNSPAGQLSGHILLVEDNEINQEIGVELLTDFGFTVDTAEDGSIAVEKVKNSKAGDYMLILMDIQMPVMDGYAATKAIRMLDNPALASIPIVALSANNFEEDRKKSMDSGMNAHMAKPIDLPQLLKMIEGLASQTK